MAIPPYHPSSSTTGRSHDDMILVRHSNHYSNTGSSLNSPLLRNGKMTRSQQSSKYATPSSSTLTSGLTSPASASSSLVFDNMGQAHDPDYTNALREQLALIGENASAAKRGAGGLSSQQRRRPGSAGRSSSSTAYDRPSALGLGLSSNFARLDLRRGDGSDFGDDDHSTEDEDDINDDVQTLSTRARSNTQATSVASHDSFGSRYYQSPELPVTSAPRSPVLAPQNASTASDSKSGVRRHLSFSTAETVPHDRHRSEHRGLFGRRGSESPSRGTSSKPAFLSPMGGRHSSGSASHQSGSHRRRSPLSSPSNSRPTTAEKDKAANKDSEWGFTGIVDVERLRSALNATNGAQAASSFFDSEEDPLHARADGQTRATTNNLSDLVQAASMSRSARAASTSALGSNVTRKPSLLRKGSSEEVPGGRGRSSAARVPSLRQRLHTARSRSTSRPSSAGSDGQHGGSSSSNANAPTPVYRNADGDRTMLSTILSGKTITNNNGSEGGILRTPRLRPSSGSLRMTSSPVVVGGPSAVRPLTFKDASSPDTKKGLYPADIDEASRSDVDLKTGNVGDTSTSTMDATEADEEGVRVNATPSQPSRVFSSSSSGKKDAAHTGTGSSSSSAANASHELRRKVEVFAMGVRLSAFKAKRKLARSSNKTSDEA